MKRYKKNLIPTTLMMPTMSTISNTKLIVYSMVFVAIACFSLISKPLHAQTNTNQNTQERGVGAFSIVQCSGVAEPEKGIPKCDFRTLIQNINAVLNWFFTISILLSTAYFAYGGILYMTGVPGNISKATGIFTTVLKGFVVVLIAWAGIYTILDWVLDKNKKVGQSATELLKQYEDR